MKTLLFTNDYTHETYDEYRADLAEQGYTEEEIAETSNFILKTAA